MGIEIPGYLQAVASVAVGSDWPEGDETALWRLGSAWETASGEFSSAAAVAGQNSRSVFSAIEGETHDALVELWNGSGGVAEQFELLEQIADELAQSCNNTAAEIEYTKLAIIAALIALAIEVAAMLAAAVPSFGASAAAIPAAEVATALTVRMLLRQLLMQVLESAATDAASAVFSGLAIQLGQIAMGHRHSVDVGKIVTEGWEGSVSGAESGALSAGLDLGRLPAPSHPPSSPDAPTPDAPTPDAPAPGTSGPDGPPAGVTPPTHPPSDPLVRPLVAPSAGGLNWDY